MNEINSVSGPMILSWKGMVDDFVQGKSLYEVLSKYTSKDEASGVSSFISDLKTARKNSYRIESIKLNLPQNVVIPRANEIYKFALKILFDFNDYIDEYLFRSQTYVLSPEILQKLLACDPSVRKYVYNTLVFTHGNNVTEQLIESAFTLFENAKDLSEKRILYSYISEMESKEVADIVILFADLAKKNELYVVQIIQLLEMLQDPKTPEFIRGIVSIYNGESLFKLKNTLSVLRDSTDVISKAGPLLGDITSFDKKRDILSFVSQLAPEQRTASAIQGIIAFFDHYMKTTGCLSYKLGLSSGDRNAALEEKLILAPWKERSDVMEKMELYIKGFTNSVQIEHFLHIVATTPQIERTKDNLDAVYAVHVTAEIALKEVNILSPVVALKPKERMDVVAKSLPFLRYFKQSSELSTFLASLEKIPQKNRSSLLELLHDHIQEDSDNISSIMIALNVIPEEDKTNSLVRALRVVFKNKVLDKKHFSAFLKNIPVKERRDVIEKAVPLLQKIDEFDRNVGDILGVIALLPQEDRRHEVLRAIPTLFADKDSTDENRTIESCILDIPKEFRARAIVRARPFLSIAPIDIRIAILYACGQQEIGPLRNPPEELEDIYYPEEKMVGQLVLTFMAPERRTQAVIRAIVDCINCRPDFTTAVRLFTFLAKEPQSIQVARYLGKAITHRCIIKNNTAEFLSYMAWDILNEAEVFIKQIIAEGRRTDLGDLLFVCMEVPRIRDACYKNWHRMLESDIPPENKLTIANWIVTNFSKLLLHEEHELMQHAFATISICDPDALKNPKNPYGVYATIKEALQTEKGMVVDVAAQEIAGQTVKIDMEKLREKGRWKGYKAKDLPEGIGPETLQVLFKTFQNRLQSLAQKERKAVDEEIQNSCGHTLDFLHENLGKEFIKGLLHGPSRSEETISPTQFQLFALLQAVLDADPIVASGERLSKREYLLLKVSESIQYCNTGQRDNLANYYNALPEKYKKGPKAEESKEAEAEAFVDDCVQKALNGVLTNEALLAELSSQKKMSQASHFTEYLRNRYHLQIGLKHQLSFDHHTGVVPLELLERDPQTVVARFFQYFTPQTIVKLLITNSEDMLKANKFLGLTSLIERSEGHTADYNQFFIFEEETMTPTRLTDRGAVALLKSVGYFI